MPRLLEVWFGHRLGYADLIRLYVPRLSDPHDAYKILADFWRSDEELRADLRGSAANATHRSVVSLLPSP